MTKQKRIIILIVVALLLVGLIVAVVFATNRHHSDHCQGIEIVLEESPGNLLKVSDVKAFILNRHLDPTGETCDSIDLARIENELATMPLVGKAECFILHNGKLQINISQRSPFFHVKTKVSDYCIDTKGMQMLTPPNLPDTIIRVTGDVTIAFAMERLYPIVCFLYKNPELASEFRRITVGRGNQISLYSNKYKYNVILADDQRYEQCFEKLGRFRQWDKTGEYQSLYQSINLQFRGQIVCKRKP